MRQRTSHSVCYWLFNDYLAYIDERVWGTLKKKYSYTLPTPKKL